MGKGSIINQTLPTIHSIEIFKKKEEKNQTIQKQTNQKILSPAILIACNNPFLMGILCKKYHRPTN